MSSADGKARLGFWQIWNMCFGFLGIQIGFELQVTNTSRIFQTLGAEIDTLPILWIAAPLTGLIVQPLVGHFSDKTWTPLGRRRPYFLVGAILASAALIVMPNAGLLWIAAGMLWIKDAALNITMEPFRAFVGDNLSDEQRPTGYAMQSFFIGIGAVGAAAFPWVLTNWFGVANTAAPGIIPLSVKIAYYVGAASLFLAVLWTILRSREYTPEQLEAFEAARRAALGADVLDRPAAPSEAGVYRRNGLVWLLAGAVVAALVWWLRASEENVLSLLARRPVEVKQELFVLAGLIAGYGVVQIAAASLRKPSTGEEGQPGLVEIIEDLYRMPKTMRQLAVVQFFSWFGLFAMWIFAVPAVAEHHFASPDPVTQGYQNAGDWWGVLSSIRNGVAALGALGIIWLAQRVDQRRLHAANLVIGGLGFMSMLVIRDPGLLWVSMVGVGLAWASIVSVPYSILASTVPARKMGVYMGIFNIFIVVPQLVAATLLGFLLNALFAGQPIFALMIAGGSFFVAALATWFVEDVVGARGRAVGASGAPST